MKMFTRQIFSLSRCRIESQLDHWLFLKHSVIRSSDIPKNVSASNDGLKSNMRQFYDGSKPHRRTYSFIHNTNTSFSYSANDVQTDVALFEMFKNQETGLLSIGNFLSALKATGLRKNDPRLRDMMDNLKKISRKNADGHAVDTQKLNLEQFKSIIVPNIGLISTAFRHEFIIPEFQDFSNEIEEIYWKCKDNDCGMVASYIPQLKRMSPNYWGVSIVTIDGQRYSIGDVNIPFTIQSCSKPLSYAIALDLLGADVVHTYVGQEPSGRNFNELILDHNKKPHNPMINAGAIIICSLLKTIYNPEMSSAEKFDFTLNYFERLAGGQDLGFNNAVFLSERECADRNYALGFYMREHKCFPENSKFRECMDFYFQTFEDECHIHSDFDEIMDFYYQCCSLEANCEIVAVMAATLANGGICPISEEKVLKPESVRDVLSLMHSCGMYDYSGQFAFKVGLPAKSGVSGAMLVVVPNVMGMCLYSPPLDALGNSCRGVQFCEELVKKFNFHRYDNLRHASNKTDPRKHKYETVGLNIVNLLSSAASGDLPGLRRHKLSGIDMTLADYDGRTALHLAAAEGHASCVEFLLKYCNVPHNVRDRWGKTPLEEAVAFGHKNVIELLQLWDEHASKKSKDNSVHDEPPIPEFAAKLDN